GSWNSACMGGGLWPAAGIRAGWRQGISYDTVGRGRSAKHRPDGGFLPAVVGRQASRRSAKRSPAYAQENVSESSLLGGIYLSGGHQAASLLKLSCIPKFVLEPVINFFAVFSAG